MQRYPPNTLHLYDETNRIERLDVLEGPTGRRTWSDREKARIVLESFESGVKVCDVPRRNGMAPQHLSTWRRLARDGKLPMPVPAEPMFASVEVAPDPSVLPQSAGGVIEIDADGVVVRLPDSASAERIAEIAAALRLR
ncbi:MAG: transposase [Pseudomonadota bacterium]